MDNLQFTAENFLEDLLENNSSAASKYYAEGYQKSGDGYGVNYTFLSEYDPNALFDITAKHAESPIFVELFGSYQIGQLVGLAQESAKNKTSKIEYLRKNHWENFAVCNFNCIDGEWKIFGETCFEDSGSPFE